MNDKLTSYQAKWFDFSNSKNGKLIIRIFRGLFLVTIIGYLLFKLIQIGWDSVLGNLPTQPLFYLIFIIIYLLLPVTEVLIYSLYWKFNPIRSLPIFIKKRIYNTEILGYSGEAYFFVWARKQIHSENRDIS